MQSAHPATIVQLVIFYADSAIDPDPHFIVEGLFAALAAMEEPSG